MDIALTVVYTVVYTVVTAAGLIDYPPRMMIDLQPCNVMNKR